MMNARLRAARCFTVAMLVLLLGAGTAIAQPAPPKLPSPEDPQALVHFKAGNEAYRSAMASQYADIRRRDFETAVKEYRAAALLERKHFFTVTWNLAQAYRQLGDYPQSIHFFKHFISIAPVKYAQDRNDAALLIEKMRAEMERDALLAPPTDVAPSTAPSPVLPPTAQPSATLDPPPTTLGASAPRWYNDRAGWTLASGGTVAVLVGAGFLLSGAGLYDDAEREDRDSVAQDLATRGRDRVVIGAVVGGLGVAAATIGVIKLAKVDRSRPREAATQVTLGPTWISIQGSF